jgi:hypothetical protein
MHAHTMLIGAFLLHKLQNSFEKQKGKENGLRNGFVEEI